MCEAAFLTANALVGKLQCVQNSVARIVANINKENWSTQPPPTMTHFYPTALKGCQGIVFTPGVRMGGWAGVGKKFVLTVSRKP